MTETRVVTHGVEAVAQPARGVAGQNAVAQRCGQGQRLASVLKSARPHAAGRRSHQAPTHPVHHQLAQTTFRTTLATTVAASHSCLSNRKLMGWLDQSDESAAATPLAPGGPGLTLQMLTGRLVQGFCFFFFSPSLISVVAVSHSLVRECGGAQGAQSHTWAQTEPYSTCSIKLKAALKLNQSHPRPV